MIARLVQARNVLVRFITSRPVIANDNGVTPVDGDFNLNDFDNNDFF
jgi:hypothetical protein